MHSQMKLRHLHLHPHLSPSFRPRYFVSPITLSSPTNANAASVSLSSHRPRALRVSLSDTDPSYRSPEEEEEEGASDVGPEKLDDLAIDGSVYQNTLRLVECSMFAAVTGLAYLISNSLAIENYFGCFFALPIVVSSMRWGVAGGRKTMVATAVLLFVLSGPVKALTYLLMHGLLGFTMGSLWRFYMQLYKERASDVGPEKPDDLAIDGSVYQNTLRLIECSMFAAVAGLAYLISNSLAIEKYFGCFFALPIVVSSMRWGVAGGRVAGGRKTMVATAVLLFVLSGPVKALTYLLMHGLLGFTMGSLWRLMA